MQVYEGYGSRLEVDDEQVSIVRSALTRALAAGAVIPLRAVVGANFKSAGLLTNGHLQIVAAGAVPAKPGPSERFTIVFTRKQEEPLKALYSWLLQVGAWNHQHGGAVLPPADPAASSPATAPAATTPAWSSPANIQPQSMPATHPTSRPAARWLHPGRRAGGVRRVNLTRAATGRPAVSQVYTALDLETTGLDPMVDRIIEIGLVKFTGTGQILDEFTTLVDNPGSSREAREVHRIDDADLVGAPLLETVLPEALAFISGTVLVAHNLDFDEAFLTAALSRHGIPAGDIPAVCTLQTCRRQLEGPAFSLAAMHKTATGQWAVGKHTALGDARANRKVLLWLLEQAPAPLHLTGGPDPAATEPRDVPAGLISCRPVPLVKASLTDLLDAFPQSPTPRAGNAIEVQHYQELLTQSVDDARLTFAEAEALTRQARLTRVTGTQLRELHRKAWYDTFAGDATADWAGLPPTRRREMYRLADGLGLTDIAEPLARIIEDKAEPPPRPEERFLRGLRVAFAGDDPALTVVHQSAVAHGAQIAVNITKTVQWLGSSTPDSDDRRHATARAHGIPILIAAAAGERIEEALREAELRAFERQLQVDEQAARARQYAAEQDAHWRPSWRATELDKDPEPDWRQE